MHIGSRPNIWCTYWHGNCSIFAQKAAERSPDMSVFRAINNNIKHDIWGNFLMARQLGPVASYGYLAKKSLALARAVIANKTITVHNCEFYDTWS